MKYCGLSIINCKQQKIVLACMMENMSQTKINQPRINLVAGTILIVVTLLVGLTVFVVMQRHSEMLLSKACSRPCKVESSNL